MNNEYIYTKEYVDAIDRTSNFCAYGNFLDFFRSKYTPQEDRAEIIAERPVNEEKYPLEIAKLAATVEILAKEYNLKIPDWVNDRKYILKEPYYGIAKRPEFREYLKSTALPEFKKRKLYIGENCMNRA